MSATGPEVDGPASAVGDVVDVVDVVPSGRGSASYSSPSSTTRETALDRSCAANAA